LEGFSWTFKQCTIHACTTNAVSVVVIGQYMRVIYLENKVPLPQYLKFYHTDFFAISYLEPPMHGL
jgi:hypothetical protein